VFNVGYINILYTIKLRSFQFRNDFRLSMFSANVFFTVAQLTLVGLRLPIIGASRSHSDTSHSVWLLCTSDQPVAETSTWQHTTLPTDRHPCPRRDSNPHSPKASGRKPTPWTARSLGSAFSVNYKSLKPRKPFFKIKKQHIYHRIVNLLEHVKHKDTSYEVWNFNSGNYLFTTDTK